MLYSIFRISSRMLSCLLFSSSDFRRSSSDFACNQERVYSSLPCHDVGARGNCPVLMELGRPEEIGGWMWALREGALSEDSACGGGSPL